MAGDYLHKFFEEYACGDVRYILWKNKKNSRVEKKSVAINIRKLLQEIVGCEHIISSVEHNIA